MLAPRSCLAKSAIWRCRYSALGRKNFSPAPTTLPFLNAGYRNDGLRVQCSRSLVTIASHTTPPPQEPPSSSSSPNAEPTPQEPLSTPKRPLWFRFSKGVFISLALLTAGFTMAAAPAIETARDFIHPPSDAETLTLYTPDNDEHSSIEEQIWAHPLTVSLVADPKFIASRPHLKIPPNLRHQNFLGGTLLGQDKIAVPPLQFSTADGSEFVSLQYLGPALCGHPGIVHGGLLATLLDEGLGRCCFPALPNKVGLTATLKIDYKKPCLAGQIVVLRAWTTKVEGRKAWCKAHLETLADPAKGETPVVLVEAEALFIEPRQAASLKRIVT